MPIKPLMQPWRPAVPRQLHAWMVPLLALYSHAAMAGTDTMTSGLLAPANAHPLSTGGTIALLGMFELIALVSFFVSGWAWARMIRREPAGTTGQAASWFGSGFGLLTIAPAGFLTWYACGGQSDGLTGGLVLQYLAMTVIAPCIIYFLAFSVSKFAPSRIAAHLAYTTLANAAFHALFSLNGPARAFSNSMLALQWIGLLITFNSWETHGWAFVERVRADDGLWTWVKRFTGEYRSYFLRMLLLWHLYFVCGEITILNYALQFVHDTAQVAPIFSAYAEWSNTHGGIPTASYALTVMVALLLAVYVETMSRTREIRDDAITGQDALSASLRATNARYAAVLQHAPFAVLQFNSDLKVDVANRKAVELMRALSPRRKLEDSTLPLPDNFLMACRGAFTGRRTSIEGELFNDESGASRWFQMTCDPVLDQNGQCIAAVAVLDDQTERQTRETELKQLTADAELARSAAQSASLAKSRFLANMSHEIRTPMNGLHGSIQLLGDPRLSEEKRLRVLETLKRSSDSMIRLLNDILDLSKVEAGAMQLNLQPVTLAQVGGNVLNLFQAAADGKSLALKLDCSGLGPTETVLADELRLQQMLSNLVGNAVKFTTRGSVTIRIAMSETRSSDDTQCYRFSVIDTGAGMTDDEAKTMFRAYHQLENQTTGMAEGGYVKGTGLGLTIVKHLAELMQGQVGVQSALGVGSTFWFEVPLQSVAAAPQ